MTYQFSRFLLIFLILFFSQAAVSQDFEKIKQELEKISKQNVELRISVMPTVQQFGFGSPEMDSLNALIHEFDSIALRVVTSIVDQYGWLGKSQIGETANGGLFVTIQHAKDHVILKKYFPLLKKSAKKGESSLSAMATMKDRMLIFDGKPQLYGTQSKMVDGKMEMLPVRDPKKLNERRKSVGLGELE